MTWFAHTRCDCGAPLTITSNAFTGETIEICAGCGYDGPARPRMDLPLRLAPPSDCHVNTNAVRLCADACGRQTKTPRSSRCDVCAHRRHMKQRSQAGHRWEQRRRGKDVPLMRQRAS